MADLWQQSLNWQPNAEQQFLFQRLYELIIQANQTLNLTRITQPLEFWEKHLWDSLRGIAPLLEGRGKKQGEHFEQALPCENLPLASRLLPLAFHQLPTTRKIIDIGTGAGFPGIPVAIALPHAQVTLLDSVRKKVTFLNTLIAELNIQNANTVLGRAEIVNKEFQHKQAYDVALIRAVGSASVCAEYALPLLKPGGLAVLYRGNWTTQETETLENTAKNLGGLIETIQGFTTPISNSIRHCVYLHTR